MKPNKKALGFIFGVCIAYTLQINFHNWYTSFSVGFLITSIFYIWHFVEKQRKLDG